jgi:hypothetical protein
VQNKHVGRKKQKSIIFIKKKHTKRIWLGEKTYIPLQEGRELAAANSLPNSVQTHSQAIR